VVLLNAGAALFIAGSAASVKQGAARSAQAIDSGDARRTLDRMIAISTSGDAAAGATA
jgi:anthranilate phosphoribosyltransferase